MPVELGGLSFGPDLVPTGALLSGTALAPVVAVPSARAGEAVFVGLAGRGLPLVSPRAPGAGGFVVGVKPSVDGGDEPGFTIFRFAKAPKSGPRSRRQYNDPPLKAVTEPLGGWRNGRQRYLCRVSSS